VSIVAHYTNDCLKGRISPKKIEKMSELENKIKSLSTVIDNHITFRQSARVLLSGASGSGKSFFLARIIQHRAELFEVTPGKIIFCTHEGTRETHLQPSLLEETNDRGEKLIEFHKGMPSEDREYEPNTMLVFDDLLSTNEIEFVAGQLLSYVTRRANHEKLYVFITTQTLFIPASKSFRILAQNVNYLIIFKSLRNLYQVKLIGTQLLGPGNGNRLVSIYQKVIKDKDYAYLVYDLHHLTDERIRFQSNLFGENGPYIQIYQ
jgi:ABC-type oligopeptide transport system ATPase subunit